MRQRARGNCSDHIYTQSCCRDARAPDEGLVSPASHLDLTGIAETGYEKTTREAASAVLHRDIEAGWHILENPARLRIQTLDSLCASLTRQMPVLSGFGSQPETMEDAPAYILRRRAQRSSGRGRSGRGWGGARYGRLLEHLDNDVVGLKNCSLECWRAATTGCAIFTAKSVTSSKQH